MRHGARLMLLLAMASTFAGAQTGSEPQGARSGPSAAGSGPRLSLDTYQTDDTLTSPLDIHVKLTNLDETRYKINRVELLIPAPLFSLHPGLCLSLVQGCPPPADGDRYNVLSPYSERFYHLSLPRPRESLVAGLLNPTTFLFLPDSYRIHCTVEYETDEGTYGAIQQEVQVRLRPPLGSLLRGGVLGSLLLALFIPTYRIARRLPPLPGHPRSVLGRLVSDFLGIGTVGAVTSVITILLIQRVGNLDLPITIDVRDWIGGLVVGVFSGKIAETLYGRLFTERALAGGQTKDGDSAS